MKQLLFLLLLCPFLSKAQTEEDFKKKSDGDLKYVQANKKWTQPAVKKEGEKRKLKDDEVYQGNVKFQIGRTTISCDSAIMYTNDGKFAAFHVVVTNPESFVIKGNNLNFDKETIKASLLSDITVTAMNGTMVGTSENLELDFSYDIYRLSNGAITPKKDN